MTFRPANLSWNPHALLVLGRVSNLPTLWSNCLAGWILGGGTGIGRWLLLCLGASFLYTGGLYLNDAFDAGFDRQRRPERPIPSGQISEALVWQLGWTWLGLGLLCCGLLGRQPLVLGLLVATLSVLYNAIHKRTALAVVPMGLCRFLVYLLAAATAGRITGAAVWSGLALGVYVVGLSYVARKESIVGPVRWWPVATLAAPVVLAVLANGQAPEGPDYRERAFYLSLLLVIWILPGLRYAFGKETRQIGFAVSNLLAGIVLVDLLATVGEPWGLLPAFGALFVLALLLQRFVPAT
jgi:4-hydroxybenzoate polyprenyltransferase